VTDRTGPGLPRPLIGVSLKLYLDPARSVAWARRIGEIARRHEATAGGRAGLFVLPSLPALAGVLEATAGTPVRVGAQDLFWEDRGAYTGAVSGADLRAVGCELVEIGHAERRRYFGETDDTIRRKLAAALRNDLIPVLCAGERTRQDPAAAIAEVTAQLAAALDGLSSERRGSGLVLAYEPEWAIGADVSASPEHVAEVTSGIRAFLATRPDLPPTSVIYGGSAGPGLLGRLDGAVDGLFLGRFAHDPEAVAAVLDEAMALT
jgi:triosephosphate isomerase